MDATWEIPLQTPPQVVSIGRNAHGFQPIDRFRLPDLWSLHVYGYEASLRVDDLELPIRPGYAGVTPPGRFSEYRYVGISVHIYVHFRMEPPPKTPTDTVPIPAMQDLGDNYDAVYRRLYSVISSHRDQPERVNARVWDVLWDLTGASAGALRAHAIHPAVRKATDLIARNLAEPLTVDALANESNVSYGYLARLFQEAYGQTVVGYIRHRRLERALHLLLRSTLPIKTIAASVGIPNLQHFNKAIRAQYQASPTTLRHSTKP